MMKPFGKWAMALMVGGLVAAGASARAQSDPQRDVVTTESPAITRFAYPLRNLMTTFAGKTDYDALARDIDLVVPGADANARLLLFRLESLLRLYQDGFVGLFDGYHATVKAIEDAIGHDRDAQQAVTVARRRRPDDTDYIDKLARKAVRARDELKTELRRWASATGAPMVESLQQAVAREMAALTETQDRAILRRELVQQIDYVAGTPFDFTQLRHGVHELRRQARWIEYYAFAVSGYLLWDFGASPSACPADAIRAGWDRIAGSKYQLARPIAPVANPCVLAACLGAKISAVQYAVSDIEEDAAKDNVAHGRDGNYASPEVTSQVSALYGQLVGRSGLPNALALLRAQVQGCATR